MRQWDNQEPNPAEGSELLAGSGGTCSDVVLLTAIQLGRDVPALPALPAHPEPLGQHLVWGHFTVLDTVRLWLISNWQPSAPLAVPDSPGEAPGISHRAGARGCFISAPTASPLPDGGVVSPAQREGGGPGCQDMTCLDVTRSRVLGALPGEGKEMLTGGGTRCANRRPV